VLASAFVEHKRVEPKASGELIAPEHVRVIERAMSWWVERLGATTPVEALSVAMIDRADAEARRDAPAMAHDRRKRLKQLLGFAQSRDTSHRTIVQLLDRAEERIGKLRTPSHAPGVPTLKPSASPHSPIGLRPRRSCPAPSRSSPKPSSAWPSCAASCRARRPRSRLAPCRSPTRRWPRRKRRPSSSWTKRASCCCARWPHWNERAEPRARRPGWPGRPRSRRWRLGA
jgi:hypothetical protein